MNREYNLVEFFSGIGSQAKALKNLGVKINTLGTCEWDIHAIVAYDLIHTQGEISENILKLGKSELLDLLKKYTFSNTGKEALGDRSLRSYSVETLRRIYASVQRNKNHVDISQLSGSEMPEGIDILTYSFPCQDLSNVGAFHGYNKGIDKDSGSRSSLLWQVGRILTEMNQQGKSLPRFLLMENVPTLLSDRHIGNFNTWISDLEKLGYINKYFQLNASSFGLPQNRPRLLMISVHVGEDEFRKELISKYFDSKTEKNVVSDYVESKFYQKYSVSDLLRINYDNPKIFSEAVDCTPNDTVSRRKIWDENPQLVLPGNAVNPVFNEIRTITTKQDRNPNSGNLYFESGIEGRSKFRYLTPRECLLFMGFTDEDYRKLKNNNVEFHKGDALFARDKVIRMAGNSIPVKLLEGIFYQVLQIDDVLKEYEKTVDLRDSLEERTTEPDKTIRSYLFSKGIRSRLTGEPYPEDADIVYPKYHTAIYLRTCFVKCRNGKDCCFSARNRKLLCGESVQTDNAAFEMGWKALIVWHCALSKERLNDTLTWIEKNVCDGEREITAKEGQVLFRG